MAAGPQAGLDEGEHNDSVSPAASHSRTTRESRASLALA